MKTSLNLSSDICNPNGKSKAENRSQYNVFALPAGFSGCAFWRYRLPLGKLKALGQKITVNIAENPDKITRLNDVQSFVNDANLISMQSPGYKDCSFLINIYKNEGKKVVVDYDDFSFDLDKNNPRYADLGIKENDVWKDQENGFDLKFNIEKFEAFKKCIHSVDLITTTTDYLANKFKEFNPNVAICPNSIDFNLWKNIPKPDIIKDQIRIGWFGGDSHFVDLKIFKTLLPRICSKYPNVRIVLQCSRPQSWIEFFKDIPPRQLEWHGWVDLKYYTLMLASRWWDIGLCPLADLDFNRCKSSIKFFEFASLKAAVVAQNMLPYSENIIDGENGFLADSEEEWEAKISNLIEDVDMRNRISENGYNYVFNNFNLDHNYKIWEKTFIDCIEGKYVGKT